ncbi:MAG: nucleotidyl transferase AbiEii/AbiGii toxin family protein [Proteobacteria bacterium]|nr:nucleotidyl transferase AbiEii/AbiGii toxin family protein [Pseudomonadota bacterium]
MKNIVQQRMEKYERASAEDEENALKEVAQEIALYALYKANFFAEAMFEGGTALRILYGLDRFSEDLDFSLFQPDLSFDLSKYLASAATVMNTFGFNIEIGTGDKSEKIIQAGMLKDDSIKKVIILKHQHNLKKKIKIKIEVDTNPPQGAVVEKKFHDFPIDFLALCGDLPSLLSGKCHALLCRPYIKGRDWYDFSWFMTNGIQPNYNLLRQALEQSGPWKNQALLKDSSWLKHALLEKINTIDWSAARNDVRRFLSPQRQESIALWDKGFFHHKLTKIVSA